ncbi:MAG: stalk domain-containing protein, partial [Bacillota bacterium]|nr:stalk domain-containing protein [Bacillota bacterium]
RSRADYILNGWDYTAKLDVPAEVVPPGRTMVPFRAAVHALGGLAFWDGKEQSVTVVTWEKPPEPVEQTVKKVEVTLDKVEAEVTYLDSATKTVKTEKPAGIDFIRPNGNHGYMLDAIEWFRLWGIPEEAMLFDPARGGLIVRGAATHNNPL